MQMTMYMIGAIPSSDDAVTENGSDAGSIGATIDLITVEKAQVTIIQVLLQTELQILLHKLMLIQVLLLTVKQSSAPANLSTKSITLADSFKARVLN